MRNIYLRVSYARNSIYSSEEIEKINFSKNILLNNLHWGENFNSRLFKFSKKNKAQ